jgi:hypothetical protein
LTTTQASQNPPVLQIKLSNTLTKSDGAKLACFATGMGKLPLKRDKDGMTVDITFPKAFEDNKARVNCTIPATPLDGTDDPRWRWLGFLFSLPDKAPAAASAN